MSGPACSVDLVALWSAPRCRSTAFLRMVLERGDRHVLHEPFSRRADFGAVEIDGVEVTTEPDLIARLLGLARTRPLFLKDTTDFHYPHVLADERFLAAATHTFLIRDPREAIPSHYALDPHVTCAAIGFERLFEIHETVARVSARPPLVVDAGDLVRAPAPTIRRYCEEVGWSFDERHLHWAAGELPEWSRTARWHVEASASTTLERRSRTYDATVDNHPRLAAYYAFHRPFYEALRARATSMSASVR